MKDRIDIVIELASRLKSGIPSDVMACATNQNGWFAERDISSALEAITTQLLHAEMVRKWMGDYPSLPLFKGEDILVVMAGNIPMVGFFDLLCVFMAGHNIYVKLSGKDRVLMEYVISQMKDIEPSIPIYIYDGKISPQRVIATGGSSAVLYFKDRFGGVPTLLRGSRHSVAVLSGEESCRELELLTNDIYSYSGLGCRNVSMLFIPRGYGLDIPSKETNQKYRNNYTQAKALLSMQGVEFLDNGSSLFVYSDKFSSALSVISVCEYDTLEEVYLWMEEHDSELQCVVSGVVSHTRCVPFGAAQSPTLWDYADDIDTMKFLS